MRDKVLKFIFVVSMVGNISPCLAGSTESGSEAPVGMSVPAAPTGSQINQDIQTSPHLSPAAKHVDVINKDDAVVLRGTVPTSGDKQKINSLAEQSGAQNIRNEIKVEHSGTNKKTVTPKARIIKP